MASRRGILLMALSCLSFTLAAGSVEAQGFRGITSQDGVDVWAVGDDGTVFRSLDAGATWSKRTLGAAVHRGVAARGSRVWIVDDGGTLWTSADHGNSFASGQPAGGVPLHAVSFADDSTGWIVGASGVILRTTSGGDAWQAQIAGVAVDLLAVRARSTLEAWACGASGTVLHTTDGGASWDPSTPLGVARDLHDIDASGAWVWIGGSHGVAATSDDGGASWSPVELSLDTRSDVNGVAVLPSGTAWLCGGGGFLRRTQDGGASFFFPEHPIVTGMSDVFFHDAFRGWACARRSRLVARTTDGGATWSVPGGGAFNCTWSLKITNEGQTIRGNTLVVDPVNRDKLYAVQGLTVYVSENRGDTWHSVSTISGVGSKTNAFLVSPTDPLKWLALSQFSDRISRTTDGGATWTSVIEKAYTEYGLPMEQDPDDPDVVYFAPEDGRIWKSEDFGATWFELSNPGFRSPDDVSKVPGTSVMYVGDGVTGSGNGQIFRSADGGLTWTLKRTVSGSEIPMIAVSRLASNLAYATNWASGGVQRTSDMGQTWVDIRPTPSEWGADIAKDDPNVAITAVYSGGASYITLDRGFTWKQIAVSGSNYGALAYDRGTFFLHQSNGIYKAVITQADMPVDNSQFVSLLAPNGGEAWTYGTSESVTWTGHNLSEVEIGFQSDPLATWQTIAASVSGTAGTWTWSIPGVPTSAARIRVSDAFDGAPLDESDEPFSILVPAMASSRGDLDFGQVPIGAARTETLTVVNDGTATLVVSSVATAGGGPFTPTRTSFSVPAGGADTLAVVFEPSTLGTYEDTLVVAGNAPSSPARVALAGIGSSGVDVPATAALPARFELGPAAPNPFGASGTVLHYTLPRAGEVRLEIYNVLGQLVATLVRERQEAGRYAVRFPGASRVASGIAGTLPSGVYFCRMKAGAFSASRRMILVR